MNRNRLYIFCLILFAIAAISCNGSLARTEKLVINIQPLGDISTKEVAYVVKEIKKIYPAVQTKSPLPLPAFAFHAPRNRYRADSILRFLKGCTARSEVTIALTNKDISTTKDGIKDWGVMGLGYRPGNACVASTFRLAKKNKQKQLFRWRYTNSGIPRGCRIVLMPVVLCVTRKEETRLMTKRIFVFPVNGF